MWQQADENEQLLLAALAQSDNNWLQPEDMFETLHQYGTQPISRSEAISLLDGLVRREILENTTVGALRYRFRLGVLQRWIKQSKSISAIIERRDM
jgi:hypothetical protein